MMSKSAPRPTSMESDVIQVDQGVVASIRQLYDSVKKALFVIGTAAIVFICARNTITWHAQQVWGASGDFWQRRWTWIHQQVFGGNEMLLTLLGTAIVTNLVFWLSNVLLFVLDLTGRPKALLKYKIQEDKNVPVDPEKMREAVKLALFNMTVMGGVSVFGMYYIMKWRGCSFGLELPTFHWVLIELIIFVLVEEVMFYYSHRLFHHPALYKYIHKKHHEWTAPVGIVAVYAHPVEHIVSNMLPPIMGPILMGSHIATAWLWFGMALASTTVSHCGYHFPFLPSPEAHDYHHLKFTNNFGVLGVLDRLHGTDNNFRATKAYERHFMSLSLVPVSQIFPDNPKSPCEKPKYPKRD